MASEMKSRNLEPASTEENPPRKAKTQRFAVADDDPDTLDLLCDILSGPSVELCRAADGGALLQLLAEKGPFDLIVADVDMPRMDGLSVMRRARAVSNMAPVLFVSGMSSPLLTNSVNELGNALLLHKPVGVSALRSSVSALLGASP